MKKLPLWARIFGTILAIAVFAAIIVLGIAIIRNEQRRANMFNPPASSAVQSDPAPAASSTPPQSESTPPVSVGHVENVYQMTEEQYNELSEADKAIAEAYVEEMRLRLFNSIKDTAEQAATADDFTKDILKEALEIAQSMYNDYINHFDYILHIVE